MMMFNALLGWVPRCLPSEEVPCVRGCPSGCHQISMLRHCDFQFGSASACAVWVDGCTERHLLCVRRLSGLGFGARLACAFGPFNGSSERIVEAVVRSVFGGVYWFTILLRANLTQKDVEFRPP